MLNHRGHECDSKPFLTWDSSCKGVFPPVYHLGDSEGMRDGAAVRTREDGQQTHPVKQQSPGQMLTTLMTDYFLGGHIRYVGS